MDFSSEFDVAYAREQWLIRERQRFQIGEERRAAALTASKQAIQAVLPRYSTIQRAYLFGSITRPGIFADHSDVDVAVDDASPEEYWAAWRDLDRATPGLQIDFRVLADDPSFGKLVQRNGILVYERKTIGLTSHAG